MKKKASATTIILILIIIILIGGLSYFFFFSGNSKEDEQINPPIDSSNTDNQIDCRVGDNILTRTSFGMAHGKITGIEKYSFRNKETKDLCCYEVETEDNIKLKTCILKDSEGKTDYGIKLKFNSNENRYLKIEEYIPELNTHCTYYLDDNEKIASRLCE
jgi:hypothetical protein